MNFKSIPIPQILFVISVAAVFIVIIFIFFDLVSVPEPIPVVEILLGAILSIALIYLTYMQTSILKKQTNIENKLFRYETEPAIEVVSAEFEGNDVHLDIANYGHGIARGIELECNLTCPKCEWFHGEPSRTRVLRYDDDTRGTLDDDSLRPQEPPVQMIAESVTVGRKIEAEPQVSGTKQWLYSALKRNHSNDSEYIDEAGFETVVRELEESGESQIKVSLSVIVRSTVEGEEYRTEACKNFTTDLDQIPDRLTLENVYKFQQS